MDTKKQEMISMRNKKYKNIDKLVQIFFK